MSEAGRIAKEWSIVTFAGVLSLAILYGDYWVERALWYAAGSHSIGQAIIAGLAFFLVGFLLVVGTAVAFYIIWEWVAYQ